MTTNRMNASSKMIYFDKVAFDKFNPNRKEEDEEIKK